jgi:hypothetical protein
MNNFQASYEKLLEVLRSIQKDENFLQQIRWPKLSDIVHFPLILTTTLRLNLTTAIFPHFPLILSRSDYYTNIHLFTLDILAV